MKRLGFGLVLPLFLVSTALADLTLVQNVEGTGEMTVMIKGDQMRVDNLGTSMIVNNKTGEMTSVIHEAKSYVVVSGEDAKLMVDQLQGNKVAVPEIKATGEKEKVKTAAGEFEAEKFTTQDAEGVKATYWVVKDYPNGASIVKELGNAMSGALGKMLGAGSADVTKLPGFPVKTVIEMDGQDPMTSVVVSVKEDPIEDAKFKVPAGYTKMEGN